MDRNVRRSGKLILIIRSLSARRAWIEMIDNLTQGVFNLLSLSARRAWIEMIFPLCRLSLQRVALRKESVDRNLSYAMPSQEVFRSLSARRAWIEIFSIFWICRMFRSLSARRAWIEMIFEEQTEQESNSRSPQGERG